jgi:hypothetical protein
MKSLADDITWHLPASLLETCFNWLTLDDIASYMCITSAHHLMTKQRLAAVTYLNIAYVTPCTLHLMELPRRLASVTFLTTMVLPLSLPTSTKSTASGTALKTTSSDKDGSLHTRSVPVIRYQCQSIIADMILRNCTTLRHVLFGHEDMVSPHVLPCLRRCVSLRQLVLPPRRFEDGGSYSDRKTMEALARNLTNLTSLALHGFIAEPDVVEFLQHGNQPLPCSIMSFIDHPLC